MAGAGCGIEAYGLPQFRQRLVLRPAEPERRAEVVVRFGGFGPQRNGTLQVTERRRWISLLTQDETEEVVRFGILVVDAKGLGEVFAGSTELAARGRLLRTPVHIICRAGGRRGELARGRALLLQGLPEPVIALPQLGVDLERLLEGGDRARQIAALSQRLPELVLDAGVCRI